MYTRDDYLKDCLLANCNGPDAWDAQTRIRLYNVGNVSKIMAMYPEFDDALAMPKCTPIITDNSIFIPELGQLYTDEILYCYIDDSEIRNLPSAQQQPYRDRCRAVKNYRSCYDILSAELKNANPNQDKISQLEIMLTRHVEEIKNCEAEIAKSKTPSKTANTPKKKKKGFWSFLFD